MILVVAAVEDELRGVRGAQTLACGIGPVDAAAGTAATLARGGVRAVVHVGVAGVRRGCGLGPTDLVIGSEAIYCDGDGRGGAPRLSADEELLEAARRALPEAPVRPIGTSARVGGVDGADVEAMEGYAVLRAASRAGVPAVEVRCVSNEVEEADRGRWRLEDAFAALAGAMPALLEEVRACVR